MWPQAIRPRMTALVLQNVRQEWCMGQQAAAQAAALHAQWQGTGYSRSYAASSDPTGGADSGDGGGKKGWVPEWLRKRVPSVLSSVLPEGNRTPDQLKPDEFTLEVFAKTLKQASRLGSVAKYMPGVPNIIPDAVTSSALALNEKIIGAMQPEHKADVTKFKHDDRVKVAKAVGCTTAQVDEVIAKYNWMQTLLKKVSDAKAKGQPLPQSFTDIEKIVGSWDTFKNASPGAAAPGGRPGVGAPGGRPGAAASGARPGVQGARATVPEGTTVPLEAKGPKGKPCGLAGRQVTRKTECPLTGKKYKRCCGSR
mmetsp:Transcript_4026/g.11678  ORF Transcript_4026/g.11678 Transcript_4026/m.11678 type:complete len:310 (-) Transcript_4026:575-1504(-)